MRKTLLQCEKRRIAGFAFGGLAAILLAGCSDASRVGDPFGNPFSSSSRTTDQTPTATVGSAPIGAVSSVPLPSPVQSRPLPAQTGSYAVPAHQSPVAARPVEMASPRGGANFGNWSATGGAAVTVAQGDTASMLATRYGVPADALLHVNGYNSASELQPGAHIVIPVYAAGGARPKVAEAEPASRTLPTRTVATAPLVKPKPETVAKAASYAKPAVAASKPVKEQAVAGAKPAKDKIVASVQPAKDKAAAAGKPAKVVDAKLPKDKTAPATAAATAPAKAVVASKQAPAVKTAEARSTDTSTPTASLPPAAPAAPAASAPAQQADAGPEFRWPARGRIIQGFKSGGNDGINIAVPEGTPVKAAESGVVAYAGNELKGYGNLILVRHPNGFVSAYANNGDIEVKKGDVVKRGQTLAKSGQSGNVSSPQLHFELRKGSTPVDPTQFLAGL